MYSTFCDSHSVIKHLLQSGDSSCDSHVTIVCEGVMCDVCVGECAGELREFLEARNPQRHHSLSLPALFAKPIVVSLEAEYIFI